MVSNMNAWSLIIMTLVVIVSVVCVYYMYAFKRGTGVDQAISAAVTEAEYIPNLFKIYDKSTVGVCDRLIVIEPFFWYVWAYRGDLYILNPEGGFTCSTGYTPAIRVLPQQFIETCVSLDFHSILDMYITAGQIPIVVPYEIEDTTFTILSALNILMKKWVTFNTNLAVIPDVNESGSNGENSADLSLGNTGQNGELATNDQNVRRRKRDLQNVASGSVEETARQDDILSTTNIKQISDKNLVQLMAAPVLRERRYNHSELDAIYRQTLANIEALEAEERGTANGDELNVKLLPRSGTTVRIM